MASLENAQNDVINIDSDTNEDDEVEIVEELTVTTEDHRCNICNEGEFLIDKLLRFGGLINEKYKFVCDKCDKNFEQKSKLNEHSSKCKGPDTPQILAKSSQSKRPANPQNRDVSFLKEHCSIICKICFKVFKTQGGLTKHTNNQHSGATHTCEVCKAAFTNYQLFRHHCFEHDFQFQMKNHVCTSCGKRFNSSANLKKHTRFHRGLVQSTSLTPSD